MDQFGSVLQHVTGPYALIGLALLVVASLAMRLAGTKQARVFEVLAYGVLGLAALTMIGTFAVMLGGKSEAVSESASKAAAATEPAQDRPPGRAEAADGKAGGGESVQGERNVVGSGNVVGDNNVVGDGNVMGTGHQVIRSEAKGAGSVAISAGGNVNLGPGRAAAEPKSQTLKLEQE